MIDTVLLFNFELWPSVNTDFTFVHNRHIFYPTVILPDIFIATKSNQVQGLKLSQDATDVEREQDGQDFRKRPKKCRGCYDA